MGCDIHLYQEAKINGHWQATDEWKPSQYEEDDGRMRVDFRSHIYDARNYRLFAVLAGVRNGVGFAGIKTGDPVIPITMPRGVPHDCCPEYRAEVEAWGADGHSHSWLALRDIQSYPWKSAKKTGLVHLDTYRAWKASDDANPAEWSGNVAGPGIEIVSEATARALASTYDSDRIYVRCEWSTSLREDCRKFLDAVLPRLQELESLHGNGNARLLFFFDN